MNGGFDNGGFLASFRPNELQFGFSTPSLFLFNICG
jgi:hypothetical protein